MKKTLAVGAAAFSFLFLGAASCVGSGSGQGTVTTPGTTTTTSTAAPTTTTTAPTTTTTAPTTTTTPGGPITTPGEEGFGAGLYVVTTADDTDLADNEILPGTYTTEGADGADAGEANDLSSATVYSTPEGRGGSVTDYTQGTGALTIFLSENDESVLFRGPAVWTPEEPAAE